MKMRIYVFIDETFLSAPGLIHEIAVFTASLYIDTDEDSLSDIAPYDPLSVF